MLANHSRELIGSAWIYPTLLEAFNLLAENVVSGSQDVLTSSNQGLAFTLPLIATISLEYFTIARMAGIRTWIRGKMSFRPPGNAKEEQPLHQDPLPFLPAARLRLESQKSAAGGGDPEPSRSLENYGLLGRLPYELRHQILVESFGGRRLHVDLSYSHPLVRKPWKARTSVYSSNDIAGYRHCDLGTELVPDTSRSEGWQWFGCVCHRRAGFSEIEKHQRYDDGEYSQSIEPCDDDCLHGPGLMCSCQVGQRDGDGAACFVGVMAWLLACQQA